ncbi:AraC family transcriptional regulator [Paenibacillus sp. Marseille-Q4541]|uniref:AraC family transcriptional regulator n=1 Tax=Paenibacillus sp. Marseille-Q4541 TaxID=2831522 RepID=UPI001BA7BE33|nr:AraC family transcriptional regulator [Paenibacillus sp. Marseille-Q4541]
MVKQRSSEHKKVYSRILLGSIGCVIITLLITSTILYMNFINNALKQVYRSDSNSLNQIKTELSSMTEIVTSLSSQIYSDSAVSKLLYYADLNIYDVIFAQQQLDNYRASLPFIESIYVYNAKSNQFYISSNNARSGIQPKSELDDDGILDLFKKFKEHRPFQPIPRTYNIGSAQNTPVSSYTYLCYSIIDDNNDLNTAVVVNISASWLDQRLDQSAKELSEKNTFIINQDGILYSSNDMHAMLTDMSDKTYIQKIIQDPSNSTYFVDTVDGVKSLITYTSPDSLGWRYVRITPYSNITQEISGMRYRILIICIGILLLGLLISLTLSHGVYRPIDKVIRKFKTLETERRDHQHILKQDFLRNTILGRETNNAEVLQQKLQYFNSGLMVNSKSLIVLVRIDQYLPVLEKYKDDIKLLKYGIMNVCMEIASPTFQSEAIDMGDDSLLLMLGFHDPLYNMERDSLIEMAELMQSSITKHLKLSISITFSPVKESIEQCILVYKQVLEASYHRLFKGQGCILFSVDIMNLKSKEYMFPVHKEKQFIESLMSGNVDKARSIYIDIVGEISEYSFTVVQLVISHLALTVNNVLRALKKNNAILTLPEFDTTFLLPNHVETMEEINTPYFKIFEEISQKLEEKRSTKQEDLIRKVHQIIERDYSNSNLSLNSIADEFSMSPIYLSRLYKQLTTNALSDKISELRLNKAKELLKTSKYTIGDIAEKTGFTSSSYFYRLFKNSTGITPSDYRKRINV